MPRSCLERLRSLPDVAWAPVVSGVLMLLAGLAALAFNQIWLFPSLGPTAYLQTETPHMRAASLYNTLVGHLIGMLAGLLTVSLFATLDPPAFALHALTWGRVVASVLAVMLTSFGGLLFKASHPPAAATTLLITLGGFRPTLSDMTALVVGVLIVALPGEALRRFRTGEPVLGSWNRRA